MVENAKAIELRPGDQIKVRFGWRTVILCEYIARLHVINIYLQGKKDPLEANPDRMFERKVN